MRLNLLALTLCCSLGLSGCASYQGEQERAGMVIGGVLGGLLGTQVGSGKGRTAAIIIGTMAGTAIGGSIGHSMDEVDRLRTSQTLETVRTGVPTSWQNPDTGNTYQVTPTRTYERAGTPCREYTVDALVAGKTQKIYGTACRQPDGSWKVKS